MMDASRLPLAQKTEELLQLLNLRGRADWLNSLENYCAALIWDAEYFCSLLFRISNYGPNQRRGWAFIWRLASSRSVHRPTLDYRFQAQTIRSLCATSPRPKQ